MKDPARTWNDAVILRIMESSALPTDSPYANRWTSKPEWRSAPSPCRVVTARGERPEPIFRISEPGRGRGEDEVHDHPRRQQSQPLLHSPAPVT